MSDPSRDRVCIDGNAAAARVAYALSEVVAIYPITPASPMGEAADAWSAAGRPNVWGTVPEVVEMQSEAGAAGALHGAVIKGGLATTFTASQGLLLMLPDLFKIAGELTPAVVHVAARTVATHALSIFGDHSDVMAVRGAGLAMLASGSPQEAHDLAAVAHAVSLESRVPVLHFFDGFRTSHELAGVDLLAEDDLRSLVDDRWVAAHRARGLTPDHPVLRGSAQNPDVFFQAREAANPFHDAVPGVVEGAFDRLAAASGRRYRLVDYHGHPEAERVVVLMGSAAGAAAEAVDAMVAAGERVGCATVRLYRPFPVDALLAALPPTVTGIAAMDRCKEPGAVGEPLYGDVVGALVEAVAAGTRRSLPRVTGVRYGLSSKELTPTMVRACLDAVRDPARGGDERRHVTVGIVDDVSHLSLAVDDSDGAGLDTDDAELRAVFYGLGSDGTVSANKAAVKIIGEQTDLEAQGYFVYDSKKSGSMTVSHVRASSRPIRSTYLIRRAGFVAVHDLGLLERVDALAVAEDGATVLLNAPYGPDEVWDHLDADVQRTIVERGLRLFVVDGGAVAAEVGMAGRVNAAMMPCFFALAGILPTEVAVTEIKRSFAAAYGTRGTVVVERNSRAVDLALERLAEVEVPSTVTAAVGRPPVVAADAPDFVQRVTARMLAGEGDLLPVSALPPDGTFPTATSRWEKRHLAHELPIWDPDLCIDCARCSIVCPHAAIRFKVVDPAHGHDGVLTKPFRSKDLPDRLLSIQVAPDDCTGCGVCVDVCPARSKEVAAHKALDMLPAAEHRERERDRWQAFLDLPELEAGALAPGTVKGSQARRPLFEFSGACAGCGETPYLKLLTQLFGDRAIVANATGCSSIYGGNLPTTPWAVDDAGRGPAWANSLFEDNAEFGLGIRLAADRQADAARALLERVAPLVGDDLVTAILTAEQRDDPTVAAPPSHDAQRARVAELRRRLADVAVDDPLRPHADALDGLADELVRRSVWIVGGDGWAYDIGFSGLDHALASGRDVNLLVLDTEVYSNTGGQASKSTPRAAVAKFAMGGKPTPKKDLAMIAMAYGDVYVATVAVGANDTQTAKAFTEAERWPGPSLILAYSTCIAHGIDMSTSMTHQRDAVATGYWPLLRYHPGLDPHEHPFRLDSRPPSKPVSAFTGAEGRYAVLARSDPEAAAHLGALAQADVDERWRLYSQLGAVERTVPHEEDPDPSEADEPPDRPAPDRPGGVT